MKRKKLFTLLALALMLGIAPGVRASRLHVVWVTDNTPGDPYIIGGGTTFDQKLPGIEIEIYQMVANRLNFDIEFKRIPWKLCLQQIENNQVDGVFPASFKPERMKIGVYPMAGDQVDAQRKTRDNAYYLYKLKSSPITWDGKGFQNLSGTIGAPMGWAIVDDLRKMNVPIKEIPIHEHSPDLLLQKRIEGIVCLETVFDRYLQRQPEKYREIEKVSPSIWEKPYYLMLSHKFVTENPELAQKIWDTILVIRQSDQYSTIVDKYVD